jgi:hypothetical protein
MAMIEFAYAFRAQGLHLTAHSWLHHGQRKRMLGSQKCTAFSAHVQPILYL